MCRMFGENFLMKFSNTISPLFGHEEGHENGRGAWLCRQQGKMKHSGNTLNRRVDGGREMFRVLKLG